MNSERRSPVRSSLYQCISWAADFVPLPSLSVMSAVQGGFGQLQQYCSQMHQAARWRSSRAAMAFGKGACCCAACKSTLLLKLCPVLIQTNPHA